MSALFVVSNTSPETRAKTCARLEASLASQRFGGQKWFHWAEGSLCWYGMGEGGKRQATWMDLDGGFIAQVGTLFYEGYGGEEALRRLWKDFRDPRSTCTDRLFGSYLIAIAKEDELWLIHDQVGMIKLYTVPALGVLCTSWLACVDTLDVIQLDQFGAQEYILLGANHGDRTPVVGVGIADPSLAINARSGATESVTTLDDWICPSPPATLDAAATTFAEILHERMGIVGRAFDNRVRCALSGGFDSRLLVAASLSAGVRPDLFVYGTTGDEDVRVAGAAATAVGLPLRHVDKSQFLSPSLPSRLEDLRPIVSFFDGIPPDGVELSGIDRLTRIAQSADEHVALNGGGGEIMRNFFYLPDRRYTSEQIEQVFYRPYSSVAFNNKGQCEEFRAGMAQSIAKVVGPGKLNRHMVELIYPLFRTRYWTSRNNSLAARVGDFLTPLLDPRLIVLSARLPLSWKNAGLLQSRCITHLCKPLAEVPLGYGFRPERGPDARRRIRSWIERQRPVVLRAYTAGLKQMFQAKCAAPPVARLLSGDRATARVLRLEKLGQPDQLNRALTLECLLQLARTDPPRRRWLEPPIFP